MTRLTLPVFSPRSIVIVSNNGHFTGDISHDSPTLSGAARRLLEAAECQVVTEIFRKVVELGGGKDPLVSREKGASYNPRCARYASLALEEIAHLGELKAFLTPFELIVTSLLASLPFPEIECLYEDVPPSQKPLLAQSFKNTRELSCLGTADRADLVPSNPTVMVTRLAIELDKIRHLHMSSLSDRERSLVVSQADRVLSNLNSTTSILERKLRHALERISEE